MVSKAQSSNPLDQRHGNSVLYLLPRTLKESASDALTSKHSDDLDSIHHFMKSMALRSPDKLLEKAKTILDGCLEFPKTMFTSLAAPESKNEAVAAKGNENPQERRPGLGRKRTRFSLKPETSQPKMILEPTFDIDPLQNPEDFFEAYEKFENARKEIQRQKGGDMAGLEEVDLSMNARCRRPGISGKKVMYKHHQYSVRPEDDILSSEASQHDIPSPPKDGSEHETAVPFVESQEKESVGSILKSENKVNELFDELLSSNIESFDGDEAVSFLQDRLQIKPIDLENLCLPDFHDVNRADVVALKEKVPKEWYTLSDVHNLPKGLRGETPVKQKPLSDSSIHITSPTLLKSPFASISLLGKRISQSSAVSDPFSSHNNDIFTATSPVEILGRESDQVSTRMELSISGKLESLAKDKAATMTVANDTHKVTRGDLTDKLVNDNPGELSLLVDDRGREFYGDLKDHGRCIDMDDSISGPNAETNVQTCKFNTVEENAEAVLLKAVSSAKPNVNMQGLTDMDAQQHGLHDIDRNALDMQEKASSFELPDSNVEFSEMESLDDDRNLLGQRNPSATKDQPVGGSSKAPESGQDQRNEEHPRVMRKERSKATRQGGQRKDISHRQSLAGAGTVWKSGVRRSSRVKHRPLEYWKGERLLYGRVHNSLPTVIGLKYISPSKGEEGGTFKVKSYVSDQFKELVELAALH